MESAAERRMAILEALSDRRRDTLDNLAFEFNVSKSTIRRDLTVLSLSYPILAAQGNGGGVYVADGYYLGRKYLKTKQEALLEKLKEGLSGEDLEVMQSILKSFAMPKKGGQ